MKILILGAGQVGSLDLSAREGPTGARKPARSTRMMMTGARRHSTSTSSVCRLAPDGWRCRAAHFSIARTGYRTVLMLSASTCFWRCTARVSRWTRRAVAWKRETGPARYCPQQGAVGNAASRAGAREGNALRHHAASAPGRVRRAQGLGFLI